LRKEHIQWTGGNNPAMKSEKCHCAVEEDVGLGSWVPDFVEIINQQQNRLLCSTLKLL